jgi:membrane protein
MDSSRRRSSEEKEPAESSPPRGGPGNETALAQEGGDLAAQDDRGRTAAAPSEIPARGWKDVMWRVYNDISEHRIVAIAGGVTFYSILAIFPAIAAFVSLYSLFADPATIQSHIDSLSGVLPGGATSVIHNQIDRVSGQGSTKLGLASLAGFAISLWSANAGIKALFDALNIVYEEREKRGFFLLNAVSLGFTLAGILLVLVAIAAMVALPAALNYLGTAFNTKLLIDVLRWPLLLVMISLAISVIYRYGPSRERAQWRWLSWGSAFAAIGWLVMSLLFSWYAANFGSFNRTYGSLGAVFGFMTWMWLSTAVLLVGAELNAEVEHQTLKDSTTGPPRPMGRRGAVMADTAGQSVPDQ